MNEEILAIFPGWMRDKNSKWLAKGWTFDLVFTNYRLIVANMKKRTGNPTFLGEPSYVSSHASERDRLKMNQISVENMLKADAENLEIPYSEIAALEIKSPFGAGHRDLLIFTNEDLDSPKYSFSIMIRDRYRSVFEEFLRTILPGKM